MRIAQRPAVDALVGELAAPRVTHGAHLDLAPAFTRHAARRVAAAGIDRPLGATTFVEHDGQSLARTGEPLPTFRLLRPRHVIRSGAVAGLAVHVDVGPRRLEPVGRRVVILAQVGRVAAGALVVPVLVDAGPVQAVARAQFLVRVEMEPPLPAFGLRSGYPTPRRAPARDRPGTRRGIAAAAARRRCSGSRNRASLPSGPSVFTKKRPSRRKNELVTPACANFASPKSPSTDCSEASCIARSWCDPRQACVSLA